MNSISCIWLELGRKRNRSIEESLKPKPRKSKTQSGPLPQPKLARSSPTRPAQLATPLLSPWPSWLSLPARSPARQRATRPAPASPRARSAAPAQSARLSPSQRAHHPPATGPRSSGPSHAGSPASLPLSATRERRPTRQRRSAPRSRSSAASLTAPRAHLSDPPATSRNGRLSHRRDPRAASAPWARTPRPQPPYKWDPRPPLHLIPIAAPPHEP